MKDKLGILGIQVGVTPDKEDNLRRALELIDEAFLRYKKIDLICLPEMFYEFPEKEERLTAGQGTYERFEEAFSEYAKKYNVNIVTGTFPMRKEGKLYNTALIMDRAGRTVGSYSKAHLFDAYDSRESDTFDRGDGIGIFDLDIGRIGVAVCYELRFPEYLRSLCLKDLELLVVPAAFYTPRHDAWDILIKGAGLSNLQYVLAVNQYGHEFFGRSSIVDPAGIVTARASDREGLVYDIIDPDYQDELRARINTYENRRAELYDL